MRKRRIEIVESEKVEKYKSKQQKLIDNEHEETQLIKKVHKKLFSLMFLFAFPCALNETIVLHLFDNFGKLSCEFPLQYG